jgi:hypothetical protein
MSEATQPLVSLPALERALSPERLAAYRLAGDRDSTDGIARYIWNIALANAIHPALQTLEITFRNEIARAAGRLTARRNYAVDRISSWLDAVPTMLLANEREKVDRAKTRLAANPRSWTEGHLIAKLDFGFWVALCRDGYGDARAEGPRLWDRALGMVCAKRPTAITTRAQIFHQFDRIRLFRNRVAHHEPIWDRQYLGEYQHILESLGWMLPKLADAVRATSPAERVFRDGFMAYRPHAETLLGTGPGIDEMLSTRLDRLDPARRVLVDELVRALAADAAADPKDVVSSWASKLDSAEGA